MNLPIVSKHQVVLFGLFGIGNLGNDSTLWVVLHQLRRHHPDAKLLCVTDALPDFARGYGVEWLPLDPMPPRGLWRISSRAAREAVLVLVTIVSEPLRRRRAKWLIAGSTDFFVVGTGALDDFGARPWDMPAWIARWCASARSAGATVKLLSVGAGPIVHPLSRWLMRSAVAAAQERTYRDAGSRDYMVKLGVGSSADRVVPDMVFAWPEEWWPEHRAPQTPPRVVGVGVMSYFGWHGGDEGVRIYRAYIEKMVRVVGHLLAEGFSVRVIVGEPQADVRAVRDIMEALDQQLVAAAGERLVAAKIDSVRTLVQEIAQTDVVLATRYHNLVFALAMGRPVLSLGYAAKFDALMSDFNLADFAQHVDDFDVGKLQDQFAAAVRQHAELVRRVATRGAQCRSELMAYFDDLFGAMGRDETLDADDSTEPAIAT